MPKTNHLSYWSLLEHLSRHNVRGWFEAGTKAEDAQTIAWAVSSVNDRQLARRLARALCQPRRAD